MNNYFLLGTHAEDEGSQQEYLYLATVNVPKISKSEKTFIDYSKLSKHVSRLDVVQRFEHPGEVNKARASPLDWKQIASLTNTGEVLIYQYEEAIKEVQKAKTTLKGLDHEGFGIAWNP